jgi:hypothetical protein
MMLLRVLSQGIYKWLASGSCSRKRESVVVFWLFTFTEVSLCCSVLTPNFNIEKCVKFLRELVNTTVYGTL